MRFREGHADRLQCLAVAAEPAGPRGLGEAVVDVLGEELGRRVAAGEGGQGVEVLVVQRAQRCLQRVVRAADVDHDAVLVERLGHEGGIDDEGRAMQLLGGAEHRALERMGDHDVVTDFNGEHGQSPQ